MSAKATYIPVAAAASRIPGMTAGRLRELCEGDHLEAFGKLFGTEYYVTADSVEKLRDRAARFGGVAP